MSSYRYLVTNGRGAVGLELHLSSRTRPYAQTVAAWRLIRVHARVIAPTFSPRARCGHRTNKQRRHVRDRRIQRRRARHRPQNLGGAHAPPPRASRRSRRHGGCRQETSRRRRQAPRVPQVRERLRRSAPGRRSRRRPPRSRRSPSPRLRARTAANARVARRAPRVRVPPRRSETAHPPLRPLPPSAPSPRVPSSSSAHPPAVRSSAPVVLPLTPTPPSLPLLSTRAQRRRFQQQPRPRRGAPPHGDGRPAQVRLRRRRPPRTTATTATTGGSPAVRAAPVPRGSSSCSSPARGRSGSTAAPAAA